MSRTRLTAALLLSALLLSTLTGCGSDAPEFVAEGRSYTINTALALPARLDAGELTDKPTSAAPELRHQALVSLRQEGDIAAEAARVITATFPTDTSGVPFYVERAIYDSQPAIVLVEAIGPEDGELVDRRVWVISLEGDVLLSGTR